MNAKNHLQPSRRPSPSSRLLVRTVSQAALLAVGAALPALASYGYGKLRPETGVVADPVAANTFWIDARSEEDFAKEHIPGALSLNEKNWKRALPRVFESWQPPRPIVVYCSAGCPASAKIAEKLTALGIEPVQVFEGGFEEWKRSNG